MLGLIKCFLRTVTEAEIGGILLTKTGVFSLGLEKRFEVLRSPSFEAEWFGFFVSPQMYTPEFLGVSTPPPNPRGMHACMHACIVVVRPRWPYRSPASTSLPSPLPTPAGSGPG